MSQLTTCANCSSPLEPSYKFCPQCSQKTNLHRLSLHDIFHDVVHYFTHADKGLFGLMKDLALTTGKVANEYVTGKRKKYFPPLNFFLIAATLYVLAATAANPPTKFDPMAQAMKTYPQLVNSPLHVKQFVANLFDRQHKAMTYLTRYSNTVAMVTVPVICLLYWAFYRRRGFNYTEHMVANMYMSGFTNIVYALIFIPIGYLLGMKQTNPQSMSMILVGVYFALQVTYQAVFYYRFIDRRTTGAAWKSVGVSLLVNILWIVLGGSVIFLYIYNGFWGLVD